MKTKGRRSATEVDVLVGARVRIRRKVLGISQAQLAQAVQLTFQQVQKYERGINRVSASKLYVIAQTLDVPIAYFFEDLPSPCQDGMPFESDGELAKYLMTPGGPELLRAFSLIDQPVLRSRIIALLAHLGTAAVARTPEVQS